MNHTTLFTSLASGVLHVEMCRPPNNSMTLLFFKELAELADSIRKSEGIRAIVISGTGRHFSSGADLDELTAFISEEKNTETGSSQIMEIMHRNIGAFRFFSEVNIPVIAAVRGVCIGSAFELALFCHYRFCGEDAVFGLPESTFNLMPGIGGISRLVRLAGTATALELSMKGSTFDARTALGYNLVDRIFPKREVVDAALAFAASVSSNYHREKSSLYLKRSFAHA